MRHVFTLLCCLFLFLEVTHAQTESARSVNKRLSYILKKYERTVNTAVRESLERAILRTALQCDSMESKAPKFRTQNYARTVRFVDSLMPHGTRYLLHNKKKEAHECFELYLACTGSALYPGVWHKRGLASYYLALMSFERGQYVAANRWLDQTLSYDTLGTEASELKVRCMRRLMHTQEDSLRYFVTLLSLHKNERSNKLFKSMLMEYLTRPGRERQLEQFAQDEVQLVPELKESWLLQGEVSMKAGRWQTAIQAFEHALSMDSLQVRALYNLAICRIALADRVRDSLLREKQPLSAEQAKYIRSIYRTAAADLRRVARMDSKEEKVSWKALLGQIEKILNTPQRKNRKRK